MYTLALYIAIFSLFFLDAILIYPINNDTLNHRHIAFEWDQEPSVKAYVLEISNDENFDEPILSAELIELLFIYKNIKRFYLFKFSRLWRSKST